MPMVPTAATLSSLSQPALLAPWGVLHNQLIEGKKTSDSVHRWSCMICRQHLKGSATGQLLSVTSLEEIGEGKSSQWVELQEKHLTVHSVGRRSGQIHGYILTHRLWTIVWLYSQVHGSDMTGKQMTRRFSEEVHGQTSLNGQKNMQVSVYPEILTKG